MKWRKAFFWGSYVVLLSVSVPHMAYVFAAGSDGTFLEWLLAYAGAFTIEGSIYIASICIYQLLKSSVSNKKLALLGLTLWILMCTFVSWFMNSVHAAHFENSSMLSGSDKVPFAQYLIFVTGSWPLFGLVYIWVSRVATKEYVEPSEDKRTIDQINQEALRAEALTLANARIAQAKRTVGTKQMRQAIEGATQALLGGIINGVREGIDQNPLEQEPIRLSSADERKNTMSVIQVKEISIPATDEVTDNEVDEKKEKDDDVVEDPVAAEDEEGEEYVDVSGVMPKRHYVRETEQNGHSIMNSPTTILAVATKQAAAVVEEDVEAEEENVEIVEETASAYVNQINVQEQGEESKPSPINKPKRIKSLRANKIGYDSKKAYFTDQGVRFADIRKAYRIEEIEIKDPKITAAALKRLVDEKVLPVETLRVVVLENSKKIVAVAITENMRKFIRGKI